MPREQFTEAKPIQQVDAHLLEVMEQNSYFTRGDIERAYGTKDRAKTYWNMKLFRAEEGVDNPFTTRTGVNLAQLDVVGPKGTSLILYYDSEKTEPEAVRETYYQAHPLRQREQMPRERKTKEERITPVATLNQAEVAYLKRVDPVIRDEINTEGMDSILRIFSGSVALIQIRRTNMGGFVKSPKMLAITIEAEDLVKGIEGEESKKFVADTIDISPVNMRLYSRTEDQGIWIMTINGKRIGNDPKQPIPARFDEAVDILHRVYGIDTGTIEHTAESVVELKSQKEVREQITSPVRTVYALFSHNGEGSQIIREEDKQGLDRLILFHPTMTFEDTKDLTLHHREFLEQTVDYKKYMEAVTEVIENGTTSSDLKRVIGSAQLSLRTTAMTWEKTAQRTVDDILNLNAIDTIYCTPILSVYVPLVAAQLAERTKRDETILVQKEREFRPFYYPYALEMIEEWNQRFSRQVLETHRDRLMEMQESKPVAKQLLAYLASNELGNLDISKADILLTQLIFDEERVLRAIFDDLIIESYDINRDNSSTEVFQVLSVSNRIIADQFSRDELESLIVYQPVDSKQAAEELQALRGEIKKLEDPKYKKVKKVQEKLKLARSRVIQLNLPSSLNPTKKGEIRQRIRAAIREKCSEERPDRAEFTGQNCAAEYQQTIDLYLAQKSLLDEAARQHKKKVIYSQKELQEEKDAIGNTQRLSARSDNRSQVRRN